MISSPLFSIVVFFLLSLLGAIVLFRYLKSSATIKKAEYQAGGAIAGFLLVYGILYGSYLSIKQDTGYTEKLDWVIVGKVVKEGSRLNDGVEVTYYPPTPNIISNKSGEFRLTGIKMTKQEFEEMNFLELNFQTEGYFDMTEKINLEQLEIHENERKIYIKTPVELIKE